MSTDERHSTDSMRAVNPDWELERIKFALEQGFAYIPESGRFGTDFWAKMLEVEEKTLKQWIKKNEIPVKMLAGPRKIGVLDAADYWAAAPCWAELQDDEGEHDKE